MPLAVIEHGGTEAMYYIETDHLGSPIAVKDKDGTVVWRWESEAFGATAPNQDADGDGNTFVLNLRFPGQYYDAESGLHYNHHRYYDPKIGRYISSDPIGIEGGINTYSYANNAPVNNFDANGLQTIGGGLTVINSLRCIGAAEKIRKYADECQRECPDDLLGMAEFIDKYSPNGSLSGALLTCSATRQAQRCAMKLFKPVSLALAELLAGRDFNGVKADEQTKRISSLVYFLNYCSRSWLAC